MKKWLCILMLMLTSVVSMAQVQTYRTTQFAIATVNTYTGKYVWGDWEKSDILITINLDTDVIIIYSPKKQVYFVTGTYNNGQAYTDNSGGRNIKFFIIDQDGDRGELRLRVERNGNSQIYIDFKNIAWVYNVRRTS